MIDLTSGVSNPLDAIADLIARFAHGVTKVLGGEGIGVDVDVDGIVALRASRLRDDAQIERIDAVLIQPLAYLVNVRLIQRPGSR